MQNQSFFPLSLKNFPPKPSPPKLKGSKNVTSLEGTYLMNIKLKLKENYEFQILFTTKRILGTTKIYFKSLPL